MTLSIIDKNFLVGWRWEHVVVVFRDSAKSDDGGVDTCAPSLLIFCPKKSSSSTRSSTAKIDRTPKITKKHAARKVMELDEVGVGWLIDDDECQQNIMLPQ